MATHQASVTWTRGDARFTDKRYSRVHSWSFDGGLTVAASASPHVVPVPLSDPHGVDPEEAFVAALASRERSPRVYACHPRPGGRVRRAGGAGHAGIRAMHDEAHRNCFIANSVRTEVVVQPR